MFVLLPHIGGLIYASKHRAKQQRMLVIALTPRLSLSTIYNQSFNTISDAFKPCGKTLQ